MVDNDSRVAVITRTKDRIITLNRTLESLTKQSYKSFTWVIVNDGGDQNPVDDIAAQARDLGVKTQVLHLSSSGRWKAGNTGVQESRSEFIILLDDDDTWDPCFLQETVSFLDETPSVGGVVTWTRIIHEVIEADQIRTISTEIFNEHLQSVYLIDITRRNLFTTNAFLYRRSTLKDIGHYDDSLPVLADWDFHLRFLEKYDIGVVPKAISNWHLRAQSGGDLGNTVLAGGDRHVFYDAVIRNRLLRKDLQAGRFGLGVLVSLGRRHGEIMHVLNPMDGVLNKLTRLVNKLKIRKFLNRAAR